MFLNTFLVLLCINSLTAVDNLCSNTKTRNKCLCKRINVEFSKDFRLVADCSGLAINSLPDIQQFPDDITDLNLSINKIQTLDSSSVNISSGTLRRLYLSYNAINYVNAKFFEGLPELYTLTLSHNHISSLEDGNIFLNQEKLMILDLSFNHIKQLPEAVFAPLTDLILLDLSENPLGEFLMGSKDVLRKTLGIGSSIFHLKLNNVGLSDLHPDFFGAYKNLRHLELANNKLTIIPTVSYTLEFLDFSGNSLTFVSSKDLNYPLLEVLLLGNMSSLTSIHPYAFYNLLSLESLGILDCPNLINFTDLAFGLEEIPLKHLILSFTGITSLNSTFKYRFRSMELVNLEYNPWECDCNILWLQEFVELFKGQQMRCASPRNLKNKKILELTHLDLPQCFPEIHKKTSHGIVVAVLIIAVIFLVAFILYLKKYPKCWFNSRNIVVSVPSYRIADQDDRLI